LVVGLITHDAGKTTVARALISELVSRGYRVGVAKPVAGHNIWYQPASVRNSIENHILVGEDAVVLKKTSGSEDPLEAINPLDIALAPLDPIYYLKSLRSYEDVMASMISSAIMLRISICIERGINTAHYIVYRRLERIPSSVRRVVEDIALKVYPRPIAIDAEALEPLILEGYIASETCYRAIANRHQVMVIESFNNSASPLARLENIDAVIAVSPGKILIYDGLTYLKALKVVLDVEGSIHRRWWPTTSEVLRLISPLEIIDTPYIEDINLFGEFTENLTDKIMSISKEAKA
jgi:predicted P-loop ATPase/GTPase